MDDDRRKQEIAFTFHAYSTNLLMDFDEPEQISDNLKQLIQKFYYKDNVIQEETASNELKRRIDMFVNLVKEILTI